MSQEEEESVTSVSVEKPWICAPKVLSQLLIAAQYLLWPQKSEFRLQPIHVKILSPVSLYFFLRAHFTPTASICFSSAPSRPQCKSRVQRARSLASYSHLSISMSITHMPLLKTSLKRRSPLCLLDCVQFPIQNDIRNLSISRPLLIVFWRCWCIFSRAQHWIRFNVRSAIAHAAGPPSPSHR